MFFKDMPIINLHNHSVFSDGTLSPAALASAARKTGINYFALTDHDTMDGQEQLEAALKDSGIKFCYGAEISCRPYENLHILAYGVNPRSPAFADFSSKLASYRARRADRIKEVLLLLKKSGIDIKFEEIHVPEGKTIGRPHVADYMKQHKIVSSRNQAFKRYLAPSKPAYVPPNGPSVEEACEAIRQAGGLPVLAHPGCVFSHLELNNWKEAGLAGIEAFYPTHSNALTRELLNIAARYGLFVTAGTDFHGPGTDRDKMYGFEFSQEQFDAYFRDMSRLFI